MDLVELEIVEECEVPKVQFWSTQHQCQGTWKASAWYQNAKLDDLLRKARRRSRRPTGNRSSRRRPAFRI